MPNHFILFLSCLVYFFFCLFTCLKISKPKKFSVVFIPVFTSFFVIRFGSMSIFTPFVESPESEVLTFKQISGESLKDAWYRIKNAHYRSTKNFWPLFSLEISILALQVGIGMSQILSQVETS